MVCVDPSVVCGRDRKCVRRGAWWCGRQVHDSSSWASSAEAMRPSKQKVQLPQTKVWDHHAGKLVTSFEGVLPDDDRHNQMTQRL